MPYVTEELWQRSPKPAGHAASIALAKYPEANRRPHVDVEIEKRMAVLQAVISAARTIRSEHEVKPATLVPLRVRTDDEPTRAWLASCAAVIAFLVKTKDEPVFERPADRARRGRQWRRAARGGVDSSARRVEGDRDRGHGAGSD